ncbi:hypothetical protein PGB90_002150 [Kerria lacca]
MTKKRKNFGIEVMSLYDVKTFYFANGTLYFSAKIPSVMSLVSIEPSLSSIQPPSMSMLVAPAQLVRESYQR